ncbi:hypothetical protein F2Q70_00012106 [Brassica cretica]|uniref:Uncharacterized protein n=1 Tax=Brassica cretica TaxID=69181 RepID=A0A8S9LNT1_BRACR|nr:hypothetical protein F2Q70_00012106 [Brassica cretica]
MENNYSDVFSPNSLPLIPRIRQGIRGITCALELAGAALSQQVSHRQEITPVIPFSRCMPSSTRSNKEKHLLFSEDPAHLERTNRKDQRSTSLDAAAFTSTDSRTHPSTDTRPSSSTDIHRSTSTDIHRSTSTDIHRSTSTDSTPRISIDPQSRSMVAIVILRQDENGNLYD